MIDLRNLADASYRSGVTRRHPLSAGRFVAKLTMSLADPPLSARFRCTPRVIGVPTPAWTKIRLDELGESNEIGGLFHLVAQH